jgi:hypothetical protein
VSCEAFSSIWSSMFSVVLICMDMHQGSIFVKPQPSGQISTVLLALKRVNDATDTVASGRRRLRGLSGFRLRLRMRLSPPEQGALNPPVQIGYLTGREVRASYPVHLSPVCSGMFF